MILHELISLEMLRVIWWVLLGVLLIGFALTDGFDFGVGVLLPFVAKTDVERRIAINTIGPVWEGNQVWFILGGGAIFAAWPTLYAVSFSGLYLALFIILFALIIRPTAFKYRSKKDDPRWRQNWDMAIFVSGFIPALLFGVAMGNVLQGVPFHLTEDLQSLYTGYFFQLLNPFALLAGIVSLSMMVMHGAAWLCVKAEGPVAARARTFGAWAALITITTFILAGIWLLIGIEGYRFVNEVDYSGPSNPLFNEVVREGTWLITYQERPWITIAPVLGIVGAFLAWRRFRSNREVAILLWSKLSLFGIISTAGLTTFPFILPSSTDPNSSLTVWDSSSSQLTLFVMLISTIIFMPLIMLYTAWVYKVLWGKVTEDDITDNNSSFY